MGAGQIKRGRGKLLPGTFLVREIGFKSENFAEKSERNSIEVENFQFFAFSRCKFRFVSVFEIFSKLHGSETETETNLMLLSCSVITNH